MSNIVRLAMLFALIATLCTAQETRGSLVGRVTDPSGAVIPGAAMQAVNVETGVANSTTTNQVGNYQFLYLLPGTYRVVAELSGFKTLVREGIQVRINDRMELNLELQVGQVGERIEVVGETPLLETATASTGQVVDHRLITELPMLHSNPMAVLELAPGIAQTRTSSLGLISGRAFDNGWLTSFAIDGSTSNSHEMTLDGVANTTTLGGIGTNQITIAYIPPADLVDEFKVQTASFDASVGYTPGAVINMSMKSGTNTLHGTAEYFKVLPELNSMPFFANRYNQPKGDLKYDRWSATTTGPVYLPRLYDGRNRTFYAYGYQGHHDSVFQTETVTVPTAKELQGDFSDLLKLGSQYQIYDPLSARQLPNGRVQRDPLAGNLIAAARINAFAKAITKYWDAPRTAGTADGLNNYPDPTQPDPNFYYSHAARIDHNISSMNRLYGRVLVSKRIEKDWGDTFRNRARGYDEFFLNRGLALDDVHTFSPGLVMNLRFGYTRFRGDLLPSSAGFDPKTVGYDQALVSQIPTGSFAFPCFSVGSFASLGCMSNLKRATDTYSGVSAFNWMRGAQNLKFGAEIRVYRETQYNRGSDLPSLSFGTSYTRGPLDNSPAAPVGQELASMLLGIPTGGSISRTASFAEQSTALAVYLQDDWKLARNLTVSLGLRYEYEGPLLERFNRSVRGFDFATPNPIEAQVRANYAKNPMPEIPADQFRVTGGLLFAGVEGQPRGLYNPPKANFMPRFGIAWTVTPKTVIRTGYGLFFGFLGERRGDAIQSGFSQSTQLIPSIDNGVTFQIPNLSNPFPDGILEPRGSKDGLRTFLGQGVSFFNSNPRLPYMQRWQFSIQRELPQRVLLDIGYVGNRGTRLEGSFPMNALPNKWLSRSPERDDVTYSFLTQVFQNPFYGLLPGTSLASQTVSRSRLLTPYPQFDSTTTTRYQGFSWYHSLQVRSERRFSGGYTLQMSYTWSKFMDATGYLNGGDDYPERVLSAQDYPHRITLSGIYELPFGKGRRLLANTRGLAGRLIAGWQVQGVYTGQSGQALGFGNAIFRGNLKDIPIPASQRTVDRWFNIDAGFERSTARALVNNLRKLSSRFSGVRGDGINTMNLSVLKNLTVREGVTLQFRGEAINALNHPMFTNPSATPTSSSFGRVTSEKSSGRPIQLGLKLIF